MNERFYELKKDKQDMMINGAMELFARNGYKRASTDEMVKVSGVSKGLWFHYFENKKGLYDFIMGYGIKYAIMEYESLLSESKDVFDMILDFEHVKMKLMDKYPYLPLLIISALEERDEEACLMIADLREAYNDLLNRLLQKCIFSENVDSDSMMTLGYMIDSSFRRKIIENYNSSSFSQEKYLEECKNIIDTVRKMLLVS